ncbi:MAG: MFS transporter [Desulfobacterales bacterium]|nr:MFS transporter [Desulfobacterales bacterium]
MPGDSALAGEPGTGAMKMKPNESGAPGEKARKPLWQRTFASVRYENYKWVWLGSCTEHIGEFMEIAALLWMVNEISGSPFILTLVSASRFIPMVIISPLGGVLTDQTNRMNLLKFTLLGFAGLSVILGILVITGLISIPYIIVIALMIGVVTSFNHPARASIVPNLVDKEDLLNAVSLDTASVMAARVVAMPIAGMVIAAFGVVPIFFLRAAGALIAIFWLSRVSVKLTSSGTGKKNPWKSLVEGLRYVAGYGVVLTLVFLYIIPQFASQTYSSLLPIFAVDVFKVGASGYGYLQAAPGLGSVTSLVLLASAGAGKNKGGLLFATGMVLGLALIVFGMSTWFIFSLLLLVIVGGMTTAFMALSTTLIQGFIPDQVRGRVMSLKEIFFGLGPAFGLIFGGIAETTGAPIATAYLGMVCFLISFILLLALPQVRRLQ